VPTFVHGKNARLGIGTQAAKTTLVDISSYLTEIGFPRSADQVETTTLGADDKTYLAGYKDQSISLSGRFDGTASAIDEILSALYASQETFSFAYRPVGGSVTGAVGALAGAATQPVYKGDSSASGGAIVTSYEITSGIGDAVSFSATLLITGPVTRATS
jgi:predicted secreted protein